ncbi:hypothetical protein ACLOJK_002200 [Asimina triloba]
MVPARNLLPQHYASSYGGCLAGRRRVADAAGATIPISASDKFMLIRSSSPSSDPFLFVDHMAEDESRTSSFNDAAAGSSRHARLQQQQGERDADDDEEEDKDNNENNKSNEDRDVGWLQLGLGSHAGGSGHQRARTADQRLGLIELDLFTDGRHRASESTPPAFHVSDFAAARRETYGASASIVAPTLPLYHPHHARTSLSIGQQPEMTWGYRRGPWDPTAASSSSSLLPFYASRPFQHPYMPAAFTSSAAAADVGPSSSARIIDPPPSRRRPGLWFVLQASHNQ